MQIEQQTMNPQFHHGNHLIDLSEGWEINHWCEELNLRSEELTEIIRRVGANLDAVRGDLAHRSLQSEKSF